MRGFQTSYHIIFVLMPFLLGSCKCKDGVVGSFKTEVGVLGWYRLIVRKTLSCTCILGPLFLTINYYFYESFGCPNIFRFCRIFSKNNWGCISLNNSQTAKTPFSQIKVNKMFCINLIILEFGSIAWMHSPFQNKTFQVYLSGVAKKNTHPGKLF